MESTTYIKYLRISPKKMRFSLLDLKRKTPATALAFLQLDNRRPSNFLYKAVKSAIATAVVKLNTKDEMLRFKTLTIEQGPVLKRFRAGARGTAKPYKKRMSHIKIILIKKDDETKKSVNQIATNIKKVAEPVKKLSSPNKSMVKSVKVKK